MKKWTLKTSFESSSSLQKTAYCIQYSKCHSALLTNLQIAGTCTPYKDENAEALVELALRVWPNPTVEERYKTRISKSQGGGSKCAISFTSLHACSDDQCLIDASQTLPRRWRQSCIKCSMKLVMDLDPSSVTSHPSRCCQSSTTDSGNPSQRQCRGRPSSAAARNHSFALKGTGSGASLSTCFMACYLWAAEAREKPAPLIRISKIKRHMLGHSPHKLTSSPILVSLPV